MPKNVLKHAPQSVLESQDDEQQAFAQQLLVEKLFVAQFQSAVELVCHAPGRVNLIGDHTDYK